MSAISPEPLTLRRLLPPGDPATVQEIIGGLRLPVPNPDGQRPGELVPSTQDSAPRGTPPRPYVLLNMVSTADGHATIDGHSGPIGNHADRELFHGLRTAVDAVMAGAGTVRTERYGPIVADESRRRARLQR